MHIIRLLEPDLQTALLWDGSRFILVSLYVRTMSEHLLEMAKALVKIENGKITVLTDPSVQHCPLRSRLYGCREESRETVERVLKEHIEDLGMYGSKRTLSLDLRPVSFGASEIIMDAMAEGLVDAAVVVCEGAGTVIVSKPDVLQAIGAHMTGLISTEPINEIQDGLKSIGCLLLDRRCIIDQVLGLKKALDHGFKKVAVTIAGNRAFEAKSLRELGLEEGVPPFILAVHTTGIGEAQARLLADECDIVWACASKSVRDIVGRRSKLQIGISIPVFALTDQGKRLVLNRALHFSGSLVIHQASLPQVPKEKQPYPMS
jgi:putative methanogenesis marker protein 8